MTFGIKDLQNYLSSRIPMVRAMDLRFLEFTEDRLTLQAPLEANINDKGTAFGGSIYSIAVLTGWGFVYLFLKNRGITADIVIQKSEIEFHKPINGMFDAVSELIDPSEKESLIHRIDQGKKGKISLQIKVQYDDDVCATMHGTYFAWRIEEQSR